MLVLFYQVMISGVTFAKNSVSLLICDHGSKEILYFRDFILELHSDLVDLCRLHFVVINLVSFNHFWVFKPFVCTMHRYQLLVAHGELAHDKFLHGNDIDHVKEVLDSIQNHNAQLVADGAVGIFTDYTQQSGQELTSLLL